MDRLIELIYRWSRKKMIARVKTGVTSRDLKHKDGLIIAQHAWVRYFERVKGFDLEAPKNEIVPPDLIGRVNAMGDGKYTVGNFRVTVIGRTIVTVDDGTSYRKLPTPHKNTIRNAEALKTLFK